MGHLRWTKVLSISLLPTKAPEWSWKLSTPESKGRDARCTWYIGRNLGTRDQGPGQFLLIEMDVLTGENNSKNDAQKKRVYSEEGEKKKLPTGCPRGETRELFQDALFMSSLPPKLSQWNMESGSQS